MLAELGFAPAGGKVRALPLNTRKKIVTPKMVKRKSSSLKQYLHPFLPFQQSLIRADKCLHSRIFSTNWFQEYLRPIVTAREMADFEEECRIENERRRRKRLQEKLQRKMELERVAEEAAKIGES